MKSEKSSSSNAPSLGAPAAMKMPPKFVPKIPTIKKEKVIENETPAPIEKSKAKDGHRASYSDSGRGRGRGFGREDDRGRAGGRGRWVMPTGRAFFSANQSVSSDSNNVKKEDEKGSENQSTIKAEGAAPVSVKISRPNEDIFSSFQSSSGNHIKSNVSSDSAYYKLASATENEEDSDEDFLSSTDALKGEEGTEVWPPAEYDPLGPLELPFGPRTRHTRTLLAGQTIFADPQNIKAMENEQMNTLFLFQMPSELRFEKLSMDSNGHSAPSQQGNRADDSEKIHLVDRKLGKLQMLKSGKVRLVTSWGRIFELHPGLAVSFAQYFATISVHPPSEPVPPPAPASSSAQSSFPPQQPPRMEVPAHLSQIGTGMLNRGVGGSGRGVGSNSATLPTTSHSNSSNSNSNTNTEDGDIHFLGFVTKKVVLTSHYEDDDAQVLKESFPVDSFMDDMDSVGNAKSSDRVADERSTQSLKGVAPGAGPGAGAAGRGRGFPGRGPVGRGPGSASRMIGRGPNLSIS